MERGHKVVRSSSLVPHNDPTILFTNAGMNQFKDYFLGNQVPAFSTAVTSQKVMRAGGKHNDLENVGRTDRHHTFFEMLGNFSFGDYFKKEAILYAWEFLTRTLELDPERLAVSVFYDDHEAYQLWADVVGIPAERIAKLGEKDNFWSMGDTGPCGPCSEIHYRLYPLKEGRNPKQSLEADDGSHLEIWNLVFMQFNRDASGQLHPLPKPSIDTGMGLERIASVVQGFNNNYDTDLLKPLVDEIADRAEYRLYSRHEGDVSCRVIADHIRASVFLIHDGVNPSNEGRGYVLRRIIRRAARHGKELGLKPGFFAELVQFFAQLMSKAYPELLESSGYVQILLAQEERRFDSTLTQGMKILGELVDKVEKQGPKFAPGEEIFKLYDTYGFPPDLAQDILEDRGIVFDRAGYEVAMKEQRDRAKNAQENREGELKVGQAYVALAQSKGKQYQFVGYQQPHTQSSILAVLKGGQEVTGFEEGEEVELLLSKNPFYAEGGGQVGDQGEILGGGFKLKVTETRSPLPGLALSKGKVISGALGAMDPRQVEALVDLDRRRKIEANHTATHLLQAALRTVVGDHVKQAGSLVNEEKLRFDFSHYAAVSAEELREVELLVNRMILSNEPVEAQVMDYDQAILTGAMAIFGEKYGDLVRVVRAGSSSKEFCGGCHTSRTGNIGLIKILSEQAVASGIRRIEAVTRERAFEVVQHSQMALESIAKRLKVGLDQVPDRVAQVLETAKDQEKNLEELQKRLGRIEAEKALAQVKETNGVRYLGLSQVSGDLKGLAESYLEQLGSGVLMLSKVEDGKVSVLLGVTKDLTSRFKANDWVKELAPLIEGRGGGKPDFAQCGGTKPEGLQAFEAGVLGKLGG